MKILVTGATGFIGSHFTELALNSGHEVVGTRSSDRPDSLRKGVQIEEMGARMVVARLQDMGELRAAVRGADCVCHFAGAFRESNLDAGQFHRINVEGTCKLLRASAEAGVRRFVYCSTAGIHGQRVSNVITELSPKCPYNSYEESKSAAEIEIRRMAGTLGIEYVIVRPTSVYGPRDSRLLKLFRAAHKGNFPLFGKGNGRRHMIFVTDLARAFLIACDQPGIASEDFIIGGPRATTLAELLEALAKVVGREKTGPRLPLIPMLALAAVVEDLCGVLRVKPPIYRRRMDFYRSDVEYDCSKAARLLRWTPLVDLPEGLAATYNSYRLAGLLPVKRSVAVACHSRPGA